MIRISNVKLNISHNQEDLIKQVCKKIKVNKSLITKLEIAKKSVDARDKCNICFVYTVDIEVKCKESVIIQKCNSSNIKLYTKEKYEFKSARKDTNKPIIVGAGPAGLFCAYILAKAGLNPIIIEQGEKVEDRAKKIEKFFSKGKLDTSSNIQFGEGGAGTFSDGKLNTGIKDERITTVLETFVEFGAPNEILFEQKPHIGTDVLQKVIVNFRKEIEKLGGTFLFSTKLQDINFKKNNVKSIITNNDEIPCENLVLALGHSSRDTFYMLYNKKFDIVSKSFAIGARIEHKQDFINKAQFGANYNKKLLPVADYKAAVHLPDGRSVYSFCMCPGGYVVAAASEDKRIAVNGMSNYKRDGENANSALLVNVTPQDFKSDHPLAGIEFQREIETRAYNVSNSYRAPAQTLGSFLYNKENVIKSVKPTYRPDIFLCEINKVLPDFVINSLKQGIVLIDKKIKGFANEDAILTAPETRSSSPVRILRNENFVSNFEGVYPCGEGAGYAGGITSAAVDGIKVAEAIIDKINQ